MSNDEVSEVYQIMNSDVLEVLVIGENVDQLSEKTSCLVSATKLAPDQQVPSSKIQSMSISDHSDAPEDQQMSLDERYLLITSIVDPEERNIEEDDKELRNEELRNLLHRKSEPIAYDGFEPSGRMHIAQGVLKAINVNKLTDAGCKVKLLIADWFAMMNDKMGGDMQKIETVGRYFIEVWKSVGMKNLEKVEFVWSSKEISCRGHEYWPRVIDIARRNSLNRIIRCTQIMGREDRDNLSAAQIMYPCMQCADVFFLNADICQMGTDQLKVNMLAREYCDKIKEDKPVILSHRMLPGLKEGQDKMSKSDPTSAIYMEDDEAEVNLKIKKAHCAPKEVEGNPCLEYVQHLVFPWFHEFVVERSEKNGGDKTFANFQDLSKDYASGELHPGDLKPALAKALNKILEPVRSHFKNDPTAKQLLQSVKSFRVTR
ncbi:putative tyrosine--tRNA ligase [Rosa chinensis]|uniref:tyrosine--tRNA ligase n=1 Tax=Rosa chinensis TaxID=74649 RepID=A0A2P6S419_ROSCH|nr:tyrosine--tRNA ligase 1, cytoplasmic [Rosa chinensis]PRQ53424.1 putative tyrosine--tRNA ligase [Rosa chinensis]